jgi:hypothetical protein
MPCGTGDDVTPMVTVPDGVLVQHTADEAVLLHLEHGTYYGLDPVGTRMLDLACSLPDAAAVVSVLLAEYDVTPEVLAGDLAVLLDMLEAQGLVVQTG